MDASQTTTLQAPGLSRKIGLARAALAWEGLWPRLVPVLSFVALFVAAAHLDLFAGLETSKQKASEPNPEARPPKPPQEELPPPPGSHRGARKGRQARAPLHALSESRYAIRDSPSC